MAAEIQRAHPGVAVDLVPGGGGDFIVTVYGTDQAPRELWNKNASGRGFPEPDQILSLL